MTRTFLAPTATWIDTPIGVVQVTPTSASHMHVSAGSDGKNDIVVNGVAYSLSLHLQIKDGKLSLQPDKLGRTYDALHASRRDWTNYNQSKATPSARAKIEKVLLTVLQKWVDENPAILTEAEAIDRNNAIYRLETDIAKLEAEITAKYAELTAHREALSALRD